jgi:DNA polymerase gamma 1
MDRAGIPDPVDYPDNLYGGDLPLPPLKGANIVEHFENIADEEIGEYIREAEEFAKFDTFLPPPSDVIQYIPGWTRYERDGDNWVVTQEAPKEKAFCFDTETFVKMGAYPIIGTAMSSKAYYLWIARELIELDTPEDQWDQWGLVPLVDDCFVVGHNVSYDRVRTQNAYTLQRPGPENFWFDTLSAHVATAGLASGQRWLYTLVNKDPELLTEEEKNRLKYRPRWVDEGSTNSLVAAYNFHVYEPRKFFGDDAKPLDEGDKEIRNIFVDANCLHEINAVLEDAVAYALKDVYYTTELFQAIWPKYLECSPSKVHLCGHYHLNGSRVPVTNGWYDWIKKTEQTFQDHLDEVTEIATELVHKLYEDWKAIYDVSPEKAQEWVLRDPWNTQLDWEIKTVKGRYAHCPNWYRPYKKDPNQQITTKSKILMILLRLTWEGSPIIWVDGLAWCYINSKGETVRIPHPTGEDKNVGSLLTKEFVKDAEVGRLNSDNPKAKRVLEIANATSYWTGMRNRVKERITATVPNPYGEDAKLTAPNIVVHGTVTRRTTENIMVGMCSTKKWRIGTELKTRFAAPDGWKVVMADFDGQEMSIAALYADAWEGGFTGASPLAYTILSGAKEKGTDSHTALSRAIFKEEYKDLKWEHGKVLELVDGKWGPITSERKQLIGMCRDVSKATNFAMLYGAGARSMGKFINRFFPEKSEAEARVFAQAALVAKKGRKTPDGYFEGGSDSGAFNMMVKVGLKSKVPELPALGTRCSNALRPAVVGNDFTTARTNYTIQAAGAEMLAVILTAASWVAREYKIHAQFAVSIHDEVAFIVPEKQAKLFAACFQMAHVLSWARFHAGCGVNDLPLSRAFFSAVAVDDRLRKSPYESTVTPSNPQGVDEPNGEEYTINDLAEDGTLKKLATRLELISKGMI